MNKLGALHSKKNHCRIGFSKSQRHWECITFIVETETICLLGNLNVARGKPGQISADWFSSPIVSLYPDITVFYEPASLCILSFTRPVTQDPSTSQKRSLSDILCSIDVRLTKMLWKTSPSSLQKQFLCQIYLQKS